MSQIQKIIKQEEEIKPETADNRVFACKDWNCSGSVIRTEKARFCCDKCGWVQRQI